ncbi:hypothetical protein Tco_0576183 [Tanacetum coccineum]
MFSSNKSDQHPKEKSRAKKKTASKRVVKKKATLSADDNIISDDPDAALELAKSINQTKAEEAEAARKIHATHARIVTESVPESAKKKSGGRIPKSIVIQDTPSAPKSKPATSKAKLKGAPSLTHDEQDAANIMQAFKESKKTNRRLTCTGGSNEGTGTILGVPDESTIVSATSSEGTGAKPGVPDEDKDITEEKVILESKKSDKVNKRLLAAKEEAEKNSEVKDDTKKTELPPSSSSLSVSSSFGDQFLKLFSDSSLVSTVKDSADVDKIPISVILETTNLPPILEIITETPVTTAVPSPLVTLIISSVQQTKTPIPTPTITTDAPIVTTVVPESNALIAVESRVVKLEKDVSELKTVDHSSEALAVLQSYVPTVVNKILKIKKEQAESQKNPQFTIKSTDKAALEEYDLKSAFYQSIHANKSFNKDSTNHRLHHALMEVLIEDENTMDKGVTDIMNDHKRKHDDEDDDDDDPPETPKGKTLTKGSKTGKSALTKEPIEEPITEVIMDDAGDDVARDDNPPQDTSEPKTRKTLNPEWFKQHSRPPTLDPEWNKCQVVLDQPAQPWFNQMVFASKDPLTFNDLMATPIDFFKYVLNGLKIKNITQDILLGPAFNQLKGTCSSSIKLEYNSQECFNALTYKLDWNNLERDSYPFDLSKPLPLQGPPGHRTVAADYFFNNDLEYLKTSDPEVTYTTSITKTKATRYKIKGIEDMVPTLWSTIKHAYDKDALMGIKHWGKRCKLWYRSQVNKFSKQNVYSTKAILGLKSVSVKKLHGYGHLEDIVVKRFDQQLYTFKECDFVDLHLNDIKDMLFLAVQHKLFHLDENVIVDFIVSLRMFTRSIILKRRVEDLQLGVESYQKKLNITKPQKAFPEIKFKEPYTPSYDLPGIFYEDLNKQKRVLRADELYKFSDGTLKSVRDEIHHRVLDFCLDYNTEMPKRKWMVVDRKRSGLMVELIDKQLREREIIRNLKRLVGARELEMDYKLMTRTV